MTQLDKSQTRYRKAFILLLLVSILATFLAIIHEYIIVTLLAVIFTALLYPVYTQVVKILHGRRALSSVIVLVLAILVVGLPLLGLLGVVAAEAIQISEDVKPWIEKKIPDQYDLSRDLPEQLPFSEQLEPYESRIIAKVGELAGNTGEFLAKSISKITQGTISIVVKLFIMVYAMFFFFIWGPDTLTALMRYIPLTEKDRLHILEIGLATTKAILKSILVIGVLQGILVGLAFWAAGIKGAIFWGTIVVVFSAVPGLGAPIIWIPGVIYLAATGQTGWAIGMTVWGIAVVGLVDNILRPHIVGSEAKMPDLLVLLATLGGILMFGAIGIIIGPVIAALLVTILEIYRKIFYDLYSTSE
ncbi:AI-2E family transporter [Nitrosococcus wardiae]|uniref:AI-2E family transporter n=1 Tax=Nitrosococcus wardiae TaxID=1814290 RepID=A0A4V1AW80_9GAMM|nr:AI-2E family transporter [Nitrosococcus wardiae]QBQ55705.1 AI-2E family transporter [Nitrosococcus wardiae]